MSLSSMGRGSSIFFFSFSVVALSPLAARADEGAVADNVPEGAAEATVPTEPAPPEAQAAESKPAADVAPAAEPTRGWKNPFAGGAQPPPGRLSVGLHAGSVLGRGYGLDVGLTAFSWLEGKLGYGYRTEHTGVAYLKATLIPTAHLSPYLVGGYSYGVTSLRSSSVRSHEAVAGLGLQARFADRFYVAGEVTANIVLLNTYSDRRVSTELAISDPWTLNAGFTAGVWFF